MAARRKLQSEIDICLKKVDEGLEYFHELWDKAHKLWEKVEQREKIAAELKKEIKKLQRHREQVKNWVTKHPDLLNKEPLVDARRKIEKEMERFKNFEKEVKTKTYSKVGLSLKRNKLSPEQREAVDWIQEQRDTLKEQQTDLETQIDKLQRKNRKKKSAQQVSQEEVLVKRLDKHKWHLIQMRDLSKRIEKGRVDPNQLDVLKDDIIYYVEEAFQDEEFWDNDLLYDGVEELEVPDDDDDDQEEERSPSPPPVKVKKEKRKKKKTADKKLKKPKRTKKKEKEVEPTPLKIIPSSASPGLNSVSPATTVSISHSEPLPIFLPSAQQQSAPADTSTPTAKVTPKPPPPAAKAGMSPSINSRQDPLSSLPSVPPTPTRQDSGARIPDFQSIMLEEERRQKKQMELQKQREALNVVNGTGKEDVTNVWSSGTPFTGRNNIQTATIVNSNPMKDPRGAINLNNFPQLGHNPIPAPTPVSQISTSAKIQPEEPRIGVPPMPASMKQQQQPTPPFLGKIDDKYKEQLGRVQYAFSHMPATSNKRVYFPRNPVRVPDSFPLQPNPRCEEPEFVTNYDVDTLFFMFHYSQGTHQQYLAAQELKKRSWRYHKKFLTWFQRHTEPIEATNEYEKGAYIYFDYETSWCQRVKTDFCFEYQYLEDS